MSTVFQEITNIRGFYQISDFFLSIDLELDQQFHKQGFVQWRLLKPRFLTRRKYNMAMVLGLATHFAASEGTSPCYNQFHMHRVPSKPDSSILPLTCEVFFMSFRLLHIV